MTSILAFLFVLGVLIFVHELGHFIMARRIGVRVITFSLGFGPKLLSFRRGDTEYCVSAIPLGGYVKMAGETPEDARTGSSDEFLSKSKWQRFQVLVMGPVMNLALAVIVMALVLLQGAKLPAFEDHPVVIGGFDAELGRRGRRPAGRRPRHQRRRQGGADVEAVLHRDRDARQPSRAPDDRARREAHRAAGGARADRQVRDRGHWRAAGDAPADCRDPQPASPAHEGGLRGRRSSMTAAPAGEAERQARERLIELIQAHEGRPSRSTLQRGDARLHGDRRAARSSTGRCASARRSLPVELKTVEPGPVEAVKLSVKQNWEWTTLIFETLGGLFTRQTSVKQLMGPVAIADLSGTAAAQDSWIPLFQLMAMISLNLGLLNLMPIPVLDGGHIAILALEGVSRRDFSMQVKEKMLLAGFVLLMMLMVTVIYNDLMRIQWIERLVPWR